MNAPELASVDGRIAETSEARIPAADDGLLRGDGVFEVIRLYAGRPYALGEHLDRLERSAAAIELPIERPVFEEEISALLTEFGEHEAQLRLVATRGGRRLAFTENLPPYADRESISVATVTYSPSEILNGVKSLSYAANMQASPAGRGRRSGRGGPGPPRRGRPRGAHVDHLLGEPTAGFGRRASRPASSPRSPATGWSVSSTSSRAPSSSRTSRDRARPSSPQRCGRSRPSRR